MRLSCLKSLFWKTTWQVELCSPCCVSHMAEHNKMACIPHMLNGAVSSIKVVMIYNTQNCSLIWLLAWRMHFHVSRFMFRRKVGPCRGWYLVVIHEAACSRRNLVGLTKRSRLMIFCFVETWQEKIIHFNIIVYILIILSDKHIVPVPVSLFVILRQPTAHLQHAWWKVTY
jgi:hypothetical protein